MIIQIFSLENYLDGAEDGMGMECYLEGKNRACGRGVEQKVRRKYGGNKEKRTAEINPRKSCSYS